MQNLKNIVTEIVDAAGSEVILAFRWTVFGALLLAALVTTPFGNSTDLLAALPPVNLLFNMMQDDSVSFVHNGFTAGGALMSGGVVGGIAGLIRQLGGIAVSTALVQGLLKR